MVGAIGEIYGGPVIINGSVPGSLLVEGAFILHECLLRKEGGHIF
jgi:hypothetical protein